jgi:PAS domain-containing protein
MASLGNIVVVAQQLLDRLGKGAPEIISCRAAAHAEEGDEETARYWLRVAKALRHLVALDPEYAPAGTGPRPIIVPASVFGRVFAALPEASLLLQPNLVVVGVNRAYLGLSGRPADALIGADLFDLFPGNPADAAGCGETTLGRSLMTVLETGTTQRMARLRYDIRNAEGRFEARWWDSVNAPVFDENGTVSHILHQTHEVTADMLGGNVIPFGGGTSPSP